jgi:hypothetical protein
MPERDGARRHVSRETNTSSSITPSQMKLWLWILQRSPGNGTV